MAKSNSNAPQTSNSASEEASENPFSAQRLKSVQEGRFTSVIIPLVGEPCVKYAKPEVDKELLKRGEREVTRYCQSINGRMSQELYELFLNENVNKATIQELFPSDNRGDVSRKVMYLHRRYKKDEHGLIRDVTKDNKVLFDPIHTFDMIMGCHLLNNHEMPKNVHHGLFQFYANISRDLVDKSLKFCNVCNPDLDIPPLIRVKYFNVYRALMPLERVHIEIFEPFTNEKIEGKYSHILYCRDYYSRYVWLYPLKNTKLKHIIPGVTDLILRLPRIPLFIETSTLEWKDMFEIIEKIAKKYSLELGLGSSNKTRLFHLAAIGQMRNRLKRFKNECLNDWNMCLLKGMSRKNYLFDIQAQGVPSNLLNANIANLKKKFKDKRKEILYKAPSEFKLEAGKGLVYLDTEDGDDLNTNVEGSTMNDINASISTTTPTPVPPLSSNDFEPNEDELNELSDSDDDVVKRKSDNMKKKAETQRIKEQILSERDNNTHELEGNSTNQIQKPLLFTHDEDEGEENKNNNNVGTREDSNLEVESDEGIDSDYEDDTTIASSSKNKRRKLADSSLISEPSTSYYNITASQLDSIVEEDKSEPNSAVL